ncbi:MAG: translation elongation factor 4 [Patescibacteria group bacterium]
MNRIRNFCIIAHIDHGKSTLADRLLEKTGTITEREMKEQLLDQMDLERERGITIKLQPVRMMWKEHELFLIDTPGHVDFTYEVSRSLAAVEGAILVVDATQGIEAQTLANLHLAQDLGLKIIPVINKIDLPAADVPRVTKDILHILKDVAEEDIIPISAKTGENVETVLDAVIERVPAPTKPKNDETQALIFDSMFDDYRGVITYVRVMSGSIKSGETMHLLGTKAESYVSEVGYFSPKLTKTDSLDAGEIGYIVTGFKSVDQARVGDTVTTKEHPSTVALPGYKKIKPFVFAGVFPKDGGQYQELRDALEKMNLSDAAFSFDPERSSSLGPGFRCGFLGMLHVEIFQERLKREYNIDIILTTPSVAYNIMLTSGDIVTIHSPHEYPNPASISVVEEPYVRIEVITPTDYMGNIMTVLNDKRGEYVTTEYIDEQRAIAVYFLPLASILTDFYDTIKSVSSGYASVNYEYADYRPCELVKMDILVADDIVEPLSVLVYKDTAYQVGRKVVDALKDVLPRQMFEIKIQAALGGKIIASNRIPPMRKDVTAKLYGGDVTRKRKLLEKQKKGKKKMKAMGVGKVDIPQEAFMKVLKR